MTAESKRDLKMFSAARPSTGVFFVPFSCVSVQCRCRTFLLLHSAVPLYSTSLERSYLLCCGVNNVECVFLAFITEVIKERENTGFGAYYFIFICRLLMLSFDSCGCTPPRVPFSATVLFSTGRWSSRRSGQSCACSQTVRPIRRRNWSHRRTTRR